MPFRRKILYYGLLLGLTLLVLEGMARLAYYAAYDQWYGGGGKGGTPRRLTIPRRRPQPGEVGLRLGQYAVRQFIRQRFQSEPGRRPGSSVSQGIILQLAAGLPVPLKDPAGGMPVFGITVLDSRLRGNDG